MCLKISRARAVTAILFAAMMAAEPANDFAAGAEAQMVHTSASVLEIRGGEGAKAWTIRYGTYGEFDKQAQFAVAAGNRAWFSHGGWLRLIDTGKGVVIGRWHFPGQITRLTPADSKVQLELEVKGMGESIQKSAIFDPVAPVVPFWPNEWLLLSRVPMHEVSNWKVGNGADLTSPNKIANDAGTQKLLPGLEEAIQRDPGSPWLQICHARLLKALGDPRAPKAFEQAIQVKTTDYSELLPLSGFLDRIGERDAARAAFERGYADFLAKGNDPRLLLSLINKLMLYYPWGTDQPSLEDPYNREVMERTYRLTPRCEGADAAWAAYADDLEAHGHADEAGIWRKRAADASEFSMFMLPRRVSLLADHLIVVLVASLFAIVIYFAVLWFRYRPQRRADQAAYENKNPLARIASKWNLQYWSRGQRVGFLVIVLIAWISTGWAAVALSWILRAAASPVSMSTGSLAGPVNSGYFEKHRPRTPEQDLFLAVAEQQSGENEKAGAIYRRLPDFAESWNNLGVIQKSEGKEQDARQSFEHALQLDPNLNEAALNLGQPAKDLWTEMHAKYMPNQPMLAPPSPARMGRMFMGGTPRTLLTFGAVAGPVSAMLAGSQNLFSFTALAGDQGPNFDPLSRWIGYALIIILLIAIIQVFRRPRPVTEKPAGWVTVLELLFPGTSPSWSLLGGAVLVVWLGIGLADWLFYAYGSPDILTSIALPNLERAYRVPGATAFALAQMRPGILWVYGVPALLFVINILLVLRSRKANE